MIFISNRFGRLKRGLRDLTVQRIHFLCILVADFVVDCIWTNRSKLCMEKLHLGVPYTKPVLTKQIFMFGNTVMLDNKQLEFSFIGIKES